jgi:outer membrane protein insertion porin family
MFGRSRSIPLTIPMVTRTLFGSWPATRALFTVLTAFTVFVGAAPPAHAATPEAGQERSAIASVGAPAAAAATAPAATKGASGLSTGSAPAAVAARTTSMYWSLYPALRRVRLQGAVQTQAPQGETIRSIVVQGNRTYETETIKFFLQLREGGTFDWATARADFRTMLNSNFFDDIEMTWERVDGGIDIIITVEERPLLRDIRIVGTEKEDKDGLVERLELLEMPVTFDQPIDRQLMKRAGDVLTTMLQGEEGLQFVQVTYTEEPAGQGGGVDAVYDVVEGDTVRIENVYFEGATEFTQQELRWLAKKTSEHWLFSFLTKNDRYSPSGWEIDQLQIRNEYSRLGYLDVAFGVPEVEVYEVDRTWPLDDTRRLYVRIPIEEGTQYRLGDTIIEGNTRFSDEQLKSLVPIASGDLIDVKGIVDARDAMQNFYSNVGYFQIQITPVPEPREGEDVADVRYVVNENALYTVRRIEFEGNTNTRDYVMRRNLQINENDLWSQGRVDSSKFKIQQLGYFDNIEEEVTIVDEPGGFGLAPGQEFDPSQIEAGDEQQTGEVDIKLKVSEVGRNQISFGGGVSALEGAFVQLGYATRNLFGRGQTFSFSGQFGGRTTSARLSFAQPYLFDKSIRFGFDVFRTNLDYIDFQQESNGISTRIGFPLDRTEFTTLYLEYNYTYIDIGDISSSYFGLTDPIYNALFLAEGQRTTSSVRPNIIYNTVNNPFNPSRGRRHTGSFEFAGGPLGGTLDFWKGIFTTTWYIPTKVDGLGVGANVSQIFAFNVDMRFVEPFSGLAVVPIFERFFLGGSTSVRGTQLRAISPVDQFGNVVGGTRAFQYNLEYIFQLANPVRIAVFHDAGAAWDDQFALPLDELRKTAGVEFRVFMPVFNVPFRFFWAYNFDPLPQFGEERSSFEFAIGTTF